MHMKILAQLITLLSILGIIFKQKNKINPTPPKKTPKNKQKRKQHKIWIITKMSAKLN